MIYFRIEDRANSLGIQRKYQIPVEELPIIDKQEVEDYIAEEIRKEVNGSRDRGLLSYSKSLGVCLLKHNECTDNELHICRVNEFWYENSIQYITSYNEFRSKYYSLESGLDRQKLFKYNGKIKLYNYVIDIANNTILNKYLLNFTKHGLKQYASPEKDSEVIMMQAYNDVMIERYIDSIYILYALQLKYGFLRRQEVVENIIDEILKLEEFRFYECEQERGAIIFLVRYLYYNSEYEKSINKAIFKYLDSKEHVSLYYDSILQFHGILHEDFGEAYTLSDYNDNVVSAIFWKYCMCFRNC